MQTKLIRTVGLAGAATCLVIFFFNPSFPTPDKILVFLTFLFLAFNRAKALLLRLLPFVILLFVYELFRGLAPLINGRVEFKWMPSVDAWLFGGLPTKELQNWLWNGQVQWYDFFMYVFYMAHFVLPIVLALIIWRYREKFYWRYISAYIVVCLAGFLTFLAFPAAPPWMAAEQGVIPPIERVSSHVWFALGVEDFPSVYNKVAANPVAAVPSLHAAFATLFSIFVFKLFGRRWGLVSLIYPLTIYFGTIYQGEHYAIDEILGAAYAVGAYYIAVTLPWPRLKKKARRFGEKFLESLPDSLAIKISR